MTTPGVRESLLAAARVELAEHGSAGVSLRAVARRAGVSHAAPKHHFGDRAGLLTALATEGFEEFTATLRSADGDLAALGLAYVRFGLEHRQLFDLMFRPRELHHDDDRLNAARQASIATLVETAAPDADPDEPVPASVLVAWAFAHGLVVLERDGALSEHGATDLRALLAAYAAGAR